MISSYTVDYSSWVVNEWCTSDKKTQKGWSTSWMHRQYYSIIINMSKCLALKLVLFIETIETYVIG